MFRSFHLWRFVMHAEQGNLLMAMDALRTSDERFSLFDAIVLIAWVEGAKDGRNEKSHRR
ncbi:hypothetical protein C4N9_20895 [Pararhodobacter marinus]|uniref:Uncharacterized protein n=1 Tax=Pararhodobacter marinus TaxID=2184063 RepID=A0A2U2C4E7_9RHOB|nr:hypothetical protein C4N9_20895 [Pararhodobacter marinus]